MKRMYLPQTGDYIDIHTHGGNSAGEIFRLVNLMVHEETGPDNITEQASSVGIHPWHLSENSYAQLLKKLIISVRLPNMIAVGEAGFDKLRGPSFDLQKSAFEAQVTISEEVRKPLIIHCVKAWGELISEHKKLKPVMPWLVHGFRGSSELAGQLLSRGMYISYWFDFALRPESARLINTIPVGRMFLETDGADTDIRAIYNKVSRDLAITVEELKAILLANFKTFFNLTITE